LFIHKTTPFYAKPFLFKQQLSEGFFVIKEQLLFKERGIGKERAEF
jgi:hypothetical protein